MQTGQMKSTIILEKGEDGELFARVSSPAGVEPGFMLSAIGSTVAEVTSQLKELIADFIENEGSKSGYWEDVDVEEIEFEYEYDLTALFEAFGELNISKIADRAGINRSLLRQYATAAKFPSAEQAKKIEAAIHSLGKDLLKVHLVV